MNLLMTLLEPLISPIGPQGQVYLLINAQNRQHVRTTIERSRSRSSSSGTKCHGSETDDRVNDSGSSSSKRNRNCGGESPSCPRWRIVASVVVMYELIPTNPTSPHKTGARSLLLECNMTNVLELDATTATRHASNGASRGGSGCYKEDGVDEKVRRRSSSFSAITKKTTAAIAKSPILVDSGLQANILSRRLHAEQRREMCVRVRSIDRHGHVVPETDGDLPILLRFASEERPIRVDVVAPTGSDRKTTPVRRRKRRHESSRRHLLSHHAHGGIPSAEEAGEMGMCSGGCSVPAGCVVS
eukprot:g3802.t1